jgi:hypothetical protein
VVSPRSPLTAPLPLRCQWRRKASDAFFNLIRRTLQMGEVPAALDGLHPGQTGVVVLGRVIMGDIAVTLVNLIQKEVLTVEESMDQGDWLLTVTPGTATKQKHGALLDYEKRLLDGLLADGGESHLSSLAGQFGKVLDETRKDLIRDAVHQGWLRHLHHDQRTAKGEELAGHVRSFRRDLRRLVSEGDQRALSGQLMPYALRFGLLSDQQRVDRDGMVTRLPPQCHCSALGRPFDHGILRPAGLGAGLVA